jgi:Tfp pilus assembly protein PilO
MKSARHVDLIGSGILSVLVVVGLVGPIRAKVVERDRIVEQREKARLQVVEQEKMENRLRQAREETEALSNKIAEIHRSFPSEQAIDSFLAELNEHAAASGTDLVRVVPGAAHEEDVFSRVPIQIEARASFDEFYRFLWGLERMTRQSQVESLRITRDGSNDRFRVEMTLHIFVSRRGAA